MNNKAKVLIICNETEIRNDLRLSLENEGYEVFTVSNNLDAFEKTVQLRPDIILLGNENNGYEIIKRLKIDRRINYIPVIFFSTSTDAKERVKGLEAGAVDYIIIPFCIKEVLARIRIHLHAKDYQEELNKKNSELRQLNIQLQG